ncbi:hypothetical protein FS749_002210 [Ceratobasidium sp. UAMH 11750]|nr:hypothetical protein FS749_002210 [Ceratobasidium sp. UAMH 11750]
MASQHLAGGKRYFRHRLKGIRLEPGTSRYDISIELFIDGKKVHKLPTIKSGRQLHWSDLTLPCHVQETSEVTIWITDIRTFRDERESVTYHVSQVMGQDAFSIESNAKKYTTHLSFMSEKEAERAYRVAFIKTQQMESQVGVIQRAGKVGAAFKLLLALGSTMAELDPTGGAKVTFAVCTQAWERLEQQDQQDTDINNFVENLARMIPSIESVERLADARLAETVMAMLNLIEDASLFILNFKSRNPWARILYSATDSTPQEQMEAFVVNFKRLREEFDTRVGVQTFGTIQTDSIRSNLMNKPLPSPCYGRI